MSVKLRLRRIGTRNKPSYRVVATDSRNPRDGRFIEIIGYYDPRHQDEKIDLARAEYWIGVGAQPSETVMSIVNRARKGTPLTPGPKIAKPQIGPGLTPAKVEAPAPAVESAPVAAE